MTGNAHNRPTRGSVLFEVMAAVAVTAMLVAAAVQGIAIAVNQARIAERRSVAAHEVGNVMERVARIEWDELSTPSLATFEISDDARKVLPKPQLRIEVTPSRQGRQKRVAVTLSWHTPAGRPDNSVRLLVWRYPQELNELAVASTGRPPQ